MPIIGLKILYILNGNEVKAFPAMNLAVAHLFQFPESFDMVRSVHFKRK